MSKKQLEKLTINTRYHPPASVSSSNINSNYNNGSGNNNGGSRNNSNANNSYNNGSNCQIGSTSNAVTVVKVNKYSY